MAKQKPLTDPMLRALISMRTAPLSFSRKSFVTMRAGKMIFFRFQVLEALAKRGLVKITRAGARRGGQTITGARLLANGDRRVALEPPTCIGCLCTDVCACPEGCSWKDKDWCSACDHLLEPDA